MSTRCSIKWREQTDASPGFHLYDDCLDVADEGQETPVYLRLDGVSADMTTQRDGATVTVAMPREMARELGLLPAAAPSPSVGADGLPEPVVTNGMIAAALETIGKRHELKPSMHTMAEALHAAMLEAPSPPAPSQPAPATDVLRQCRDALSAMLTHMGMDEDEWNRPTFNQARAAIAAADAALSQPAPAQPHGKWEGAEEWMPLAWELCADECGEDACTELVWEGGAVPEPWGDRWLKYEDEAKRLIALVRKHVPSTAPQPAPAQPVSSRALAMALLRPECDRLREWAAVGPVQRAAVLAFADAISAPQPAPAQAVPAHLRQSVDIVEVGRATLANRCRPPPPPPHPTRPTPHHKEPPMPRGKPPKVIRPVLKNISLPEDLVARVELELYSELEGRVPHGAWARLVERLLREHLDRRQQPQGETS